MYPFIYGRTRPLESDLVQLKDFHQFEDRSTVLSRGGSGAGSLGGAQQLTGGVVAEAVPIQRGGGGSRNFP